MFPAVIGKDSRAYMRILDLYYFDCRTRVSHPPPIYPARMWWPVLVTLVNMQVKYGVLIVFVVDDNNAAVLEVKIALRSHHAKAGVS